MKLYDPALAWNGYTLTLYDTRKPVLVDMNGRVVHSWPTARMRSRVRLLPDGSVLGLGLGRQLVEHDWEGNRTWQVELPKALPHHDVIRLRNGNTLTVVLEDGQPADTLLEIDREGKVVWSWRAIDHVRHLLPDDPTQKNDLTHINSLQELPENRWHAAGDERFRPGNLLISARNLDHALIVDRRTGELVWSYGEGLDRQHEALMTPPGMPGAGLIQVFNNRRAAFHDDRQSEILELDPVRGEVVWRYRTPGFYSDTGGTQQLLPNGNLLITSTRGGRVFEVTRDGRLAWQWVSPWHEPVRALRVAADAAPQLSALPPQPAAPVVAPPGYLHVDPPVYRFARRGSRTKARIAGQPREVLKLEDDCREMLLPRDAEVVVAYGVDPGRLRAAGRVSSPPEFRLTVAAPPGGAPEVVFSDRVGAEGEPWRERTLSLAAHGVRQVRLCVEVDAPKGEEATFAYWQQPVVTVKGEFARTREDDGDAVAPSPGDLTPEELEVQRKHLETLGYVG